eukprot:GHVP01049517.1.p1 GENE.GHVP01049517.1~~GHVP01049517.1.p1  ORF type:complete len:211 (+),score=53.49 GHVP01049517.1:22-654(+)
MQTDFEKFAEIITPSANVPLAFDENATSSFQEADFAFWNPFKKILGKSSSECVKHSSAPKSGWQSVSSVASEPEVDVLVPTVSGNSLLCKPNAAPRSVNRVWQDDHASVKQTEEARCCLDDFDMEDSDECSWEEQDFTSQIKGPYSWDFCEGSDDSEAPPQEPLPCESLSEAETEVKEPQEPKAEDLNYTMKDLWGFLSGFLTGESQNFW